MRGRLVRLESCCRLGAQSSKTSKTMDLFYILFSPCLSFGLSVYRIVLPIALVSGLGLSSSPFLFVGSFSSFLAALRIFFHVSFAMSFSLHMYIHLRLAPRLLRLSVSCHPDHCITPLRTTIQKHQCSNVIVLPCVAPAPKFCCNQSPFPVHSTHVWIAIKGMYSLRSVAPEQDAPFNTPFFRSHSH